MPDPALSAYARLLPDLDLEAVTHAHTVVSMQRTRLPADALHILAREVLHRVANGAATTARRDGAPSAEELETFCDDLTNLEEDGAPAKTIRRARSKGATLDCVYLGWLAPAARRIGERWEADETSLVETTVAAGRIYAILRGLRRAFAPPDGNDRRHALFASAPGETHTLGVTMAADMFRQRGWSIDLAVGRTHDELVESLRDSDHAIIGLSASRPELTAELARIVLALHICKPWAKILVCGRIAELDPEIAGVVGADGAAIDAASAIEQMERLAGRMDANAIEAGPEAPGDGRRRST